MTQLRPGDRVRVYQLYLESFKGTVSSISGDRVFVKPDGSDEVYILNPYHRRCCVRLVEKRQHPLVELNIKLSRSPMDKKMDGLYGSSNMFDKLFMCKKALRAINKIAGKWSRYHTDVWCRDDELYVVKGGKVVKRVTVKWSPS